MAAHHSITRVMMFFNQSVMELCFCFLDLRVLVPELQKVLILDLNIWVLITSALVNHYGRRLMLIHVYKCEHNVSAISGFVVWRNVLRVVCDSEYAKLLPCYSEDCLVSMLSILPLCSLLFFTFECFAVKDKLVQSAFSHQNVKTLLRFQPVDADCCHMCTAIKKILRQAG